MNFNWLLGLGKDGLVAFFIANFCTDLLLLVVFSLTTGAFGIVWRQGFGVTGN